MENERKITKEELKELIETLPEGTLISVSLEGEDTDE